MHCRLVSILTILLSVLFFSALAAPPKKPPPPLKKVATLAPAQEDSLYETRGFIPLRGSQSGHFSRGTYVVVNDISVAAGDTLEIKEGSTVMVKRMASITVAGMFILSGNRFAPVTITTLADTALKEQNPDLARFKGITIQQNGRAHLRFMLLSGSQYGLVAEKGSTVLLDSAIFTNNLYADCRIGDSTYTSNNGKPISAVYNTTPALPTPNQAALVAAANVQPAVSVVSKPDDWKLPVRVSGGVLAAAGAAGWILGELSVADNQQKLNKELSPNAITYKTARDNAIIIRNCSIAVLCAALAGIGLTVVF